MTDKIKNILNDQINEEFYSAYLYLDFSIKLERRGFKGAANWMRVQAREENDHALGFVRFLLDRGEAPQLKAVKEPETVKLNTLLDFVSAGLKHEQHITARIAKIYELAGEEKDYALESFIKWYIDEQVEEEANATEIIDKINLIGKDSSALYLLDQELMARTYTPSGPYAAASATKA